MQTFSADDLFRNGTYKGQQIPHETMMVLKEQARQLSGSLLWKMLKAEAEWHAIKSLLEKGETADDIRMARVAGNFVQAVDDGLRKIAEAR